MPEIQIKANYKLHTAALFSKKQQENPKVTRRKNNLIKKKKAYLNFNIAETQIAPYETPGVNGDRA